MNNNAYSKDEIIGIITEIIDVEDTNLRTFEEIKEQLENTESFLLGFKQYLEEIKTEQVSEDGENGENGENIQKIDEKLRETDEKIQQTQSYLEHMDKIKETGENVKLRAQKLLPTRIFKDTGMTSNRSMKGGKKKTRKTRKTRKTNKSKKRGRR